MKIIACMLLVVSTVAHAQTTKILKVLDGETDEPLIGATVRINSDKGFIADAEGVVALPVGPQDTISIRVSFVGYEDFSGTLVNNETNEWVVRLIPGEELEAVYVTTTRSSRTIDDIPTRIEVLGSEELEEKAIMRSSNIAMVLRESTGIQMQVTSASSANQSIRIQGLDGRYTQLLKDGFPLFGGFSGSLSIMQVPPLDLKQIEVIKGSNSTLFGGGAIAGLVNLVSYTPNDGQKLKFMLDQTSAGGTTLNGFYTDRFDNFGVSLYTSANRQEPYDSNNDDFSDIPHIRSITINPTLFYYFNELSTLRVGLNGTFENRIGGDMQVIEGAQNGIHQFTEDNTTDRISSQVSFTHKIDEFNAVRIKNSITYFNRQLVEPAFNFNGEQWSSFSEATYSFGHSGSSWITGINVYTDQFNEDPFDSLVRDYQYVTVGAFGQNIFKVSESLSVESGLRFDQDLDFGFFALPRLSVLAKLNQSLSVRFGGGLGYKLPTIFTEDAESQTYQGILPIDVTSVGAERSTGANFDINYRTLIGEKLTLSVNQLFFFTTLRDALVFRGNDSTGFFYENADGPVESIGLETNVKLGYGPMKLFANYALIDTRLKFDNLNEQKALTPKHNVGLVLVYEEEDKWRIGYEAYYTGSQFRNNRTQTDDFWIMGVMIMRKFGRFSLYVNFENFTDTRQHKLENFDISTHYKPEFPEIWAPTDGHVINGGIIIDLAAKQ